MIRTFFYLENRSFLMKTWKLVFFLNTQLLILYAESPVVSKINFGPIQFTSIRNGESNRRYIWLHGDEKTAKMAAEYHITKYLGTAFLINCEERVVRIDGLRLDPNRIFSDLGVKNNLLKYHPQASKKKRLDIINLLNIERDHFLSKLNIPDGGILIALHNNSRGYSIDSELKKATDYSIKSNENRHDFFLCTDERDYKKLALSPFNVVFQKNQNKNDDGSLSNFISKEGIRYINIEVRLGWLSQQKKMLKYLEENIP